MNIGKLNKRIEILKLIEQKDSFGEVMGEWITVSRIWASIQPNKGTESIEVDQLKVNQTIRFAMRFYAGLTTKNRIKFQEKIYNILSVTDIDMNLKETVVISEEVNSG